MAMIRWCASCSGPLPDDARFCPACGEAVATGVGPAVLDDTIGIEFSQELRHMTVVFCDIVGSTDLSASMDAEQYGELIEGYQQSAVSIARAFGGDVEGYSGDGILFRFGWPQAHDDDAINALCAALEIVGAVAHLSEDPGLALRVGVHSGQAVVGLLGGGDRRATMSVGETLNVAARLQGAAAAGGSTSHRSGPWTSGGSPSRSRPSKSSPAPVHARGSRWRPTGGASSSGAGASWPRCSGSGTRPRRGGAGPC
jgi:class 3 adenylate cyclase